MVADDILQNLDQLGEIEVVYPDNGADQTLLCHESFLLPDAGLIITPGRGGAARRPYLARFALLDISRAAPSYRATCRPVTGTSIGRTAGTIA